MIPQQEIYIGLVVSLVATLATEVIVFPLWSVNERLYPLLLGRANALKILAAILDEVFWLKKTFGTPSPLKGTSIKPCKPLLSAIKFNGSPTRTFGSYQFLSWHRVGTSVWHQTQQKSGAACPVVLYWGMDSDNLHGIPRHLLERFSKDASARLGAMQRDGYGEWLWI